MSDDLKSRLRSVGGVRHDGATRWYINPDGPEAADRIEKLEAALQRANANVEEYERKFYLGADRTEKLEAALREITVSARLVGDYYHVKIAHKALEGKDD